VKVDIGRDEDPPRVEAVSAITCDGDRRIKRVTGDQGEQTGRNRVRCQVEDLPAHQCGRDSSAGIVASAGIARAAVRACTGDRFNAVGDGPPAQWADQCRARGGHNASGAINENAATTTATLAASGTIRPPAIRQVTTPIDAAASPAATMMMT